MQVTFLEARVPLTKKFTATSKEPYPNAYEFKSHTVPVKDLDHFAALIKAHAAQGHCLLKGQLAKPLEWESRAGSTNPNTPTRWLCFDLDGMAGVATVDEFMAKMSLSDISYIIQWSASYGVYGDFSLRAHVFVLTTDDVVSSAAKVYLKQSNLDLFQSDLSLTKTNIALRWPLDITTCQNDKLIFITPPECTPPSINQFSGDRITVVKKAKDFLVFNNIPLKAAEQIKLAEEAEINRLRQAKGLPERKAAAFKLKDHKGESYMPNPDQATVTGVKELNGFIRLNLNGGDSWAYFHPVDNPTFIFNFKGEPTYKTSELVPDYWASLQSQKRTTQAKQSSKLILAFRDLATATYYNGWYDQQTDEITLHVARSERQIEDFLIANGQPVPDAIPQWNVIYDPQKPPLDLTTRTVNTFTISPYMRLARGQAATATPKPTPTIDWLIKHVIGEDMYDHFFNWLAFCFQNCVAPQTAWVFIGTQGTGKGLLVNQVLVPLFGKTNVAQVRMEQLEDKFNGHMENTMLCIVDEADVSDSGRAKMIMANLKNQITEPYISIRRMRMMAYETVNRVGFIFASNVAGPVVIEEGDRRFNVGNFQPNKIVVDDTIVKQLWTELLEFAYRLQKHTVDISQVRTPRVTAAKLDIQMTSKTSADVIGQAIKDGDLATLWDALPTGDTSMLDTVTLLKTNAYKQLITDLLLTKRDRLSRDELRLIFDYNVGKIPPSPYKFTMYLKHHGLAVKDLRMSGKIVKGVYVIWSNSDQWFDERKAEIEQDTKTKINVVPMNLPKAANHAI